MGGGAWRCAAVCGCAYMLHMRVRALCICLVSYGGGGEVIVKVGRQLLLLASRGDRFAVVAVGVAGVEGCAVCRALILQHLFHAHKHASHLFESSPGGHGHGQRGPALC
jgi:hypothetical protein